MPFTIVQISSLELLAEDDKNQNIIYVGPEVLREVGGHELVKALQFKDDREEWLVKFKGRITQGEVEVHVTYSLGMDGQQVETVDVVTVPSGLTVHQDPEFETQNCDGEEFGG